MQKIFINKETNMVEQILEVNSEDELPDDYFKGCYSFLDYNDKINAYNLKYNKETKEFEVIEGIKPFDIPVIEEKSNLEKENEELRSRLEKLEEILIRDNESLQL